MWTKQKVAKADKPDIGVVPRAKTTKRHLSTIDPHSLSHSLSLSLSRLPRVTNTVTQTFISIKCFLLFLLLLLHLLLRRKKGLQFSLSLDWGRREFAFPTVGRR